MNSKLPSIEYISCGVGRIGAAMDVNECGANSVFEFPIVSSFAGRDFPISLVVPAHVSAAPFDPICVSFYATLSLSGGKYTLRRPGCPDCVFEHENDALYRCARSGEALMANSGGAILYQADGGKLAFSSSLQLESVVLPDGLSMSVTKSSTSLKLTAAGSPEFAASFILYNGRVASGTVRRGAGQQAFDYANVMVTQSSSAYTVYVTRKCCDGADGAPSTYNDKYVCPYSASQSGQLIQSATMTDTRVSSVFSVSLQTGSGWVEATASAPNRTPAVTRLESLGANLVKATSPDARSTYFGLRRFLSGEPPFVVGALGDLGVARMYHYDAQRRLDGVSDAFCFARDGSLSRSMLGPAEFDSSWTAAGAYVMSSDVGEPAIAPLSGGLWAKGQGWNRFEKDATGVLLPGEPALLSAVAFGVGSGSVTLEAVGHFEDGTSASCSGSFEIGAACLTPICVPVCFRKPLSRISVVITGSSGVACKAAQLIRGLSARRFRHDAKWLGASSYAGKASLLQRDSDGRALYSYGAAPSPLVSYFEGSGMPLSAIDDLGYSDEAAYSSPSQPSSYDPTLPYFRTESRKALGQTCLAKATMSHSTTHRRVESFVEEGVSVALSLNAIGDVRSASTASSKTVLGYEHAFRVSARTSSNPDGSSAIAQSATYSDDALAALEDGDGKSLSFGYDSCARLTSAAANSSALASWNYGTGWGGKLSSASIGVASANYSYGAYASYGLPSSIAFSAFSSTLFSWSLLYDGPDCAAGYSVSPIGVALEAQADPETGVATSAFSDPSGSICVTASRMGGAKKVVRYGPSDGRGVAANPASAVYRGDSKTLSRSLEREGWLTTHLWKEGDRASLWSDGGNAISPNAPAFSSRLGSHPAAQFAGDSYSAINSYAGSFAFSFYLASASSSASLLSSGNGFSIQTQSGLFRVIGPGSSVYVTGLRSGWNAACVSVDSSGAANVALNGGEASGQIGQCLLYGLLALPGLKSSFLAVKEAASSRSDCKAICLMIRDAVLGVSALMGGKACFSLSASHSYSSGSDCQGVIGIPLDGGFASSDGRGPASLCPLDGSFGEADAWLAAAPLGRPSRFEFSPGSGTLMCRAMGARLSYRFPGQSSGSVRLGFDRRSPLGGCLFQIRAANGGRLAVVLTASGAVLVETERESASTGLTASDGFHTLSFSYSYVPSSPGYAVAFTAKVDSASAVSSTVLAYEAIGSGPLIHLGADSGGDSPFDGLIGDVVLMSNALGASGIAAYESGGLQAESKAGFDALGRLCAVTRSALGSLSRRNEIDYAQDPTYGETSRVSQERIYGNGVLERSINYSHDSAGRLSYWDGYPVAYYPHGWLKKALGWRMAYDAAGNLTSMSKPSSEALTYSYLSSGAQNRLSSVSSTNGTVRSFSYSGYSPSYLSGETVSAGQTVIRSVSYSYCCGYLVSATVDGNAKTYAYSPSGFLASSSYLGETRRYLFDASGRLLVDSRSEGYTLSYEYGPDGNPWLLVESSSSGETRYLITCDSLGRILRLDRIGAGGHAEYSYSPWGEPTLVSDTAGGIGSRNRLLYKSYLYDDELAAYCLGKRHYDPTIGRFLEPDDVDCLKADAIGGLNLYAYCLNDPITYSDATGHFPVLVALILAGAAIGAASYTVSEAISYGLTGEWNWSWGQFAGNIIGGAIGGAFAGIGAGAFVTGFITGFSSTAIGMGLQVGFESASFSAAEILLTSFFRV